MSKLDKLIEWMEEQDKIPYISYKDAILKAKQLQKEEPKTYTQELEEENKYLKAEFEANKDKVFTQEDLDAAYQKGKDSFMEGAILIGEPFRTK